jgi:uncharacterized membrane protein
VIRKHLIGTGIPGEAEFRWRGEEVTRLEGFSDAVFAFAVTLLVVSLEVPRSFPQLIEVLRGFPPFAACFYLLAIVWRQHVLYFRRYGLQDGRATALNCALLFFVLFYVYPMKFMFVAMFERGAMQENQIRTLFLVFAAGFGAISTIFALLQWHAWRRRQALALNAVERLQTRQTLIHQVAMLLISAAGATLAETISVSWVGLTGFAYLLIPLYYAVAGPLFRRQRRRLLERDSRSDE